MLQELIMPPTATSFLSSVESKGFFFLLAFLFFFFNVVQHLFARDGTISGDGSCADGQFKVA